MNDQFQPRLHPQRAIALGPILFIIAVLAVIAAVISSGSGSFNANTNTESEKAMAEVIINSCGAYQDAMNVLLHNGCDPQAIDWTPAGGNFPTGAGTWTNGDYTGGNGTNRAGSGLCAMYDPRGGGMIFKQLPAAALLTTLTGAYVATMGASTAALIDAYAGFPWPTNTYCYKGFGTCPGTGAVTMSYYYLTKNVCTQINNILQNNIQSNYYVNFGYAYYQSIYNGTNVTFTGGTFGIFANASQTTNSLATEGCGQDSDTWVQPVASYKFLCPLQIR